MPDQDLDAQAAELEAEAARLRDELRRIEDLIHSTLRKNAHANADKIEQAEKDVRRIVLRLSDIDRERIEINVAKAL